MRNLRIAAVCVCSLFAVSDLAAQQQIIIDRTTTDMPIQFPGMGPRQPKTGTARLRGRVMAVETGGPVRRAQVRISGPDIGSKTAITDADGRFEFRDLPGGRFNVSATKSGFVTVQYGQLRPFESGKAIDLVDGQMMDKADIAMPRGGVISGRLIDEFGDPIADAVVNAMRSVWSGGRRRLQPTGRTSMTNDLGQFRIYGLSPGDYYVSATFRGGDMMAMEIAMAATMGGGATGGPTGSNPSSGYAPTYYPGTPNGAEAQKIAVAAGQEAQNTDFALLPVKLAKISGTVISSEGKPVEGSMINATPRNGDAAGMMMAGAARTDKNGNFTLSNVAPGDYTLQSRALTIMTSGGGDNMTFSARIGGSGDGSDSEIASMPVSVNGDDLSGVILVTSKGASATGHLMFEGSTKPNGLTSIRVSAVPVDAEGPVMAFGGSGTVKADGAFELRGLSGTRLVRAANLPPGWMLKEVRVNSADITDTGMEFKAGEAIAGVEIVLTSKLTQISGTVTGAGSQPAKDYTLVVFSDDPQRWTLVNSRFVAGTRPDQDGRFQVKNLPAGGYYAIAVEYLAQGEWNDPDVLERLKANATKFSLAEGETKTLELKIK
jgi:protocatechuate 3,4-dioxygenase beta subunit